MSDDNFEEKLTAEVDHPALGLDFAPAPPAASAAAPYQVLARKYRPSSFADLIGQEAMVKTLSNAFELGRIHQAYILTGVRGVGKTTTARILARAFNYQVLGADSQPVDRPQIDMPVLGVHCQAIIESRHVDVIEMDAASHTGIDDVREIIESARYRPVMARTKVYIIDEVHMLSKQAFNGLLKTLEEPPEHVKFLFATTEIDKVPVTVRSRCQRFDLRRIEADQLIRHLAAICEKEGVAVEMEALALIARAAEGSARDSLSLLDQAIAHGAHGQGGAGGGVRADELRIMLGLADRTRIIDLFEEVMKGDIAAALTSLKDLHDSGADPGQILIELAEFTHFVTRLKLVPASAKDTAITEEERTRGARFAETLSMPVLTRAWQLLLKGTNEVKESGRPLAAADMVLIRLAYAADLPTPDEAIRRLAAAQNNAVPGSHATAAPSGSGPNSASSSTLTPAPRAVSGNLASSFAGGSAMARATPNAIEAASPQIRLTAFEDIVAQAANERDIKLKLALERDVRLVRFEEGSIEISLTPTAAPDLPQVLIRRLQGWTGQRWVVAVSKENGAPTLKEQAEAKARETLIGVQAHPLVRSVMAHFPGSQIVAIRNMEESVAVPPPPVQPEDALPSDEIGYSDSLYTEDDL
jgi:DNA polymerase-3 subunit gamma/tau